MKSQIAGVQLSLWCQGEGVQCRHLCMTSKLPMKCKYFGKMLLPDTRLHRDGHPMRLDVCMMADLAHDVYEVEDNKEEYHDEE